MQIQLELQNADKLARLFRAAPDVAYGEYMRGLERIAIKVSQDARKNAPVAKNMWGTGGGHNLRQSINYTPIPGGFSVKANKHYAVYVDQGTRPHLILPRFKSTLAWRSDDGKWHFAKQVKHPGTKPTYFFTHAVTDSKDFANRTMDDAMLRVMRHF